ncbi:hypothetical protein G5S35_22420 [Paraburkholderia tropica]|uniref:hypothetical protein n=1 Tax=Paraburkholderia tropica TaxID=92647 RepID=UPI0015FF0F51|nr:hypothetical protein [Paraburkholderia tropica]QNB14296.1 hypothetical protein G5S35_22420 [Paraburkholderia tropica]
MSRIGNINLPTITASISGQNITYADSTQLQFILNKIAAQLDLISSGSVAGTWNAASQPPTALTGITTNPTGRILGITYGIGDYIKNEKPSIFTGTDGKQYITLGWVCTSAGNAGTHTPPTFADVNCIVNP